MKKTTIYIAISLIYFTITSISYLTPYEELHETDLKELINELPDMIKVNKEPVHMKIEVATLCIQLSDEEINEIEEFNENNIHSEYHANIYVNDIGKTSMTKVASPNFPRGTVIIKEKFKQDSDSIELYTIMIKREPDYNHSCGDWEFGVINGDLSQPNSGKIESCMNCHINEPLDDFVFRDYYLDDKTKRRLK